jgi:hypothetical protein
MSVASIDTTKQQADIVTKDLAHQCFCELCAKIGLVNLK